MDLKDRKILYQLDVNSRQTNSEIAKKVGLSKQVVGFRIKKLIEEKVISFFYSVIDISKLGFTVHKAFLRLQNIDREKEKELIEFLVLHPNVVWIASCDGRFDLAFGTWAKDMDFLDKTLTELNTKFGEYIAERQISSIIRGDYFVRDYLISRKEPSDYRESFFGAVPAAVKMDSNDWSILVALGRNSRTTAVDISKEMSLSTDAIIDRIKKLEKSGVIRHYNFVPNESQYPYLHYKVLIGFKNISEERERTLREYCRINPNIVYIVKSLGPWEFEIDLEIKNAEKFREIMMDIKTKFNDILKDYSALHIYQIHKYNFCPSTQNKN
ncbi:Lrp/AsnC family transcriptional regulator [Candidatus Woesearchaeota archaeon]|jgi:Lrp/AsnC family transcriptional regulator, leucine-responsive regulatory protein|nr:Lrp/AsnC family transcriptional regulator [Candidatus Woesearchaeota archaeon]MBT3537181.1 Lrp/AsnC family transcriptional regulator [Candidatus Woesearchaeota archaeon]MBT4696673.1 Lrp/AsnC family transcriptional regulator [Candidatus Woesearchaeota archaeon]MBT4716473.1 Lrp/AsnC family transcriptional regulator [Candidatus Woesearchaeota archaeon]MBT7106509.1 Lrp/AsnC family transcriptional regulator [Candidatus Woesearchaeota archaeon]